MSIDKKPYITLARKYRPQAFDELVGQPHVSATLTKALKSKRIGQAYLFAGMRGVGKTSAARILAKCLNCAKGPTDKPCNECPSCVSITQGNSLDVIEIDGASNRGIDEVRSLRETVPFSPTSGSFRIYIIDEVHMLTTEAFNALLKTLEEPPSHVKFIFATTAPNKVPATILSRCQRFDFRRLDAATIVQTLKDVASSERIAINEPAMYAIARAALGSLRDAEVILEQLSSFASGKIQEADVSELLGAIESDVLFDLANAILDRDTSKALSLIERQLAQGKDALQLLSGLLRHARNLLIVSSVGGPSHDTIINRLIDEPSDHIKLLEEQSKKSSSQELLLFLQILSGAYELTRKSQMPQIILELVIIKLATREGWQSIEQISRTLDRLSANGPNDSIPAQAMQSKTQPSHSHMRTAQGTQPAADVSSQTTTPDLAAPLQDQPSADAITIKIWPAFLEKLSAHKMSLAAYLADSKPLQSQEGTLTVGLPAFALHQEVLSLSENRKLIERLLGELCNMKIKVEYATLPESMQPSTSQEDSPKLQQNAPPIVQDIVNLFNATLLDPPKAT